MYTSIEYTSKYRMTMLFLALVIFFHGFIGLKGISWPDGTYGLPQSLSGCPDGEGVKWKTGWRRQYLERKFPMSLNSISKSSHLNASLLQNKDGIERSFCIKTISNTNDTGTTWPAGKYCIYKYGDSCPRGMKTGSVFWDDINTNDRNEHGGILPEGNYDNDTKIEYCCQDNGHWNDPIDLPVERPFYLLSYKNAVCQHVKWAVRSLESIVYDTEDDHNGDKSNGSHIYVKFENSKQSLVTSYYCYYRACKSIFRNITGSFSSKDSSHQYCSWTIAVKENLVISLNFTEFTIPDCKLNYLDIYEGYDTKGTLLGRYCGPNAMKAVSLNSTRNTLFVMLKSGGNFESLNWNYVKFKAVYKTMVNSKHCHETLTPNTDKGSFTSPMFPTESYPDNQNCSWTISSKDNDVISLIFTYFYLLGNCEENYVTIYDGPNTISPILIKLCAENIAANVPWNSTGNSLYIVYKSGANSKKDARKTVGFKAKYKVIKLYLSEESFTTQNIKKTSTEFFSPSNPLETASNNPLIQIQPTTEKIQSRKNSGRSSQLVIILTTSLASVFLLLIILVILYKRRLISTPTFVPRRKDRKQSENPIYEQTNQYSSNNPLYSSTPVSLYEEVKTKKTFLPDIRENHVVINLKPKTHDVNERHYETPKFE